MKLKEIRERAASAYFISKLFGFVKKENPAVFRNSKFIQWPADLYNKLQKRMGDYLNVSLVTGYAISIKRELRLYPMKISGIILISFVVITSILSFIFHYELRTAGLITRLVLLIVGFCGLSCDVEWPTIRRGSVLFKILSR